MNQQDLVDKIIAGEVVGSPTDTVWGLLASIEHKEAVDKITNLKDRSPQKPYIIIAAKEDILSRHKKVLNPCESEFLAMLWPDKVSVALLRLNSLPDYLNSKDNTQAWRAPRHKLLSNVLKATGPVVATSANPSGQPPATTHKEFKSYFKDQVPALEIENTNNKQAESRKPSTLISLNKGAPDLVRSGEVSFSEIMDLYRTAEISAWKNAKD